MIDEKEFLSSIKSIETENYIDRIFYRPLGFRIAKALKGTGITPNAITILSIFVGVGAGSLFYYSSPFVFTLLGILGMITANILDCVDGQLARMTNIKSEIGRILDGFAGDLWFLTIYIALALRLNEQLDTSLFFLIAALSGLSHLTQAAVTDYYKTLHLFFISPEKGKEWESSSEIKTRLEKMPWGVNKFFTFLYFHYTRLQMRLTPRLQEMITECNEHYPQGQIPQEVRVRFRRGSMVVMKAVDLLTFNGRTIPLFLTLLTGQVWFYFVYEILFLNIILVVSRNQHEKLCYFMTDEIQKREVKESGNGGTKKD